MKKTIASPDSVEREYTRVLLAFSKKIQSDINQLLIPAIGGIKNEFDSRVRGDVDLKSIMDQLVALSDGAAESVVTKLPGIFSVLSRHNDNQFRAVVKANTGLAVPMTTPTNQLLGVNVFRSEPYLTPLMDSWVNENTALIKSIPTKLYPEVEGIIQRGVVSGTSVKDLKDQIKSRFPVTDSRAKLIAQDQILKANASLTRYRLQSVGVKKYIWRTVSDSRVRPAHADRNGKEYSWDEPPSGGLHPGQEVRCRCRAEPVWENDDEMPLTDIIRDESDVESMRSRYGKSATESLARYFGQDFDVINKTLRDGRTNADIKAIDAAFALAPAIANQAVLYRGVKLNAADVAKLTVGKSFVEKAFSSTSTEFHQATKFGWNKGASGLVTVTSKKKIRDPLYGTQTHVTLSTGKTHVLQRLNATESMGLPGWHDVDGGYLSGSEQGAIDELLRRSKGGVALPTVFKIIAPTGTKVIPAGELARNKFEKEVLLDRGIRYKVISVKKEKLGNNPLFDPNMEVNVITVDIM